MSNQNLGEANEQSELHRSLSNRHLQLIAIGGAIGTGLFMGSGKTISLAGPSILFIYGLIGIMVFFVMRALGELLLSNLKYKSFIDLSTDLIDPWAGYFVGWTISLFTIFLQILFFTRLVSYMKRVKAHTI
jgi:D-serine/D-alanine/glycine transporter